MELAKFLATLEEIAPLRLAEDWDNVGLLLAPTEPRPIFRVLLTIDLTADVVEEAIEHRCEAIVAYHPVIFSGLKRIVPEDRTGGILLRLLSKGISVYSPHTALDATEGGVNDWLAQAFGDSQAFAIHPKGDRINQPEALGIGQGRVLTLTRPAKLSVLLGQVKQHLKLDWLRVATADKHASGTPIHTVSLCPGAGGSILKDQHTDLLLTGEMRHHDVLAARERGTSVVLTEHSNSERGYLPQLKFLLENYTKEVLEVFVSRRDSDPLEIK